MLREGTQFECLYLFVQYFPLTSLQNEIFVLIPSQFSGKRLIVLPEITLHTLEEQLGRINTDKERYSSGI